MKKFFYIIFFILLFYSCQSKTNQSHDLIPFPHYWGDKNFVFIGKVENSSQYKNGIFTKEQKEDELVFQARSVLRSLLVRIPKFTLSINKEEAKYIINLRILEFAVKTVPSESLFGFTNKRTKEIILCKLRLYISDSKGKQLNFIDAQLKYQPNEKELGIFTQKDNYDLNFNRYLLTQALAKILHEWLELNSNDINL